MTNPNNNQEERIQALINCLRQTRDDEADCIEFNNTMDCLAEWLADGADPQAVIKPEIEAHMQNSVDCAEEFNMLVSILKAEREGELDDL